jgi:hypothetical protein
MFDTDLYQQVLGLSAPWRVAEIKQHLFCKSLFSEVGHLASMFR